MFDFVGDLHIPNIQRFLFLIHSRKIKYFINFTASTIFRYIFVHNDAPQTMT